jgi:hypothetical protein
MTGCTTRRVRLLWSDIDAALTLIKLETGTAAYATIVGNFPVIECDVAMAARLISEFHAARVLPDNDAD